MTENRVCRVAYSSSHDKSLESRLGTITVSRVRGVVYRIISRYEKPLVKRTEWKEGSGLPDCLSTMYPAVTRPT